MAKDYTGTLNLPSTDFPMRANLPGREPETLKYWDSIGLYRLCRKARRRSRSSSFTTALPFPTATSTWARR